MFRAQLPRFYELLDLIPEPASPDAYFQNSEEKLRFPHVNGIYARRERALQGLDNAAWSHLKGKAARYLTCKDRSGRGWQQLFDLLNEARGYNYLKGLGASFIRFVPEVNGKRTPDLEAALQGQRLLCEVKTLNISQEELAVREGRKAGRLSNELSDGFLKKLDSSIEDAIDQMRAYDDEKRARLVVFINPCFDDILGECKEDYFHQIDSHLLRFQDESIEIVLYNDHTPFYKALSMANATLINEP